MPAREVKVIEKQAFLDAAHVVVDEVLHIETSSELLYFFPSPEVPHDQELDQLRTHHPVADEGLIMIKTRPKQSML